MKNSDRPSSVHRPFARRCLWGGFCERAAFHRRSCACRCGNFAGFTLLELLVLVGVIAILAALLLPALSQAKGKARTIECQGHLKNWLLALVCYTEEHDGWFLPREGHARAIPGTVDPDLWADVCHPANGDVWYNALPPYLGQDDASNNASMGTGTALFYDTRLWHCPAAKFPREVVNNFQAFFSLPLNSKLMLRYSSNISITSIEFPSHTVAFLDARVNPAEAKVLEFQTDLKLGQPAAYASRFAPRHGQGGNLVFIDGHVARLPGYKVVETNTSSRYRGLGIIPQDEVIWTPKRDNIPNLGGDN